MWPRWKLRDHKVAVLTTAINPTGTEGKEGIDAKLQMPTDVLNHQCSDTDTRQQTEAEFHMLWEFKMNYQLITFPKKSSQFNEFRLQGRYCDAVIRVDNVEFKIHRIILCDCSSYFR